MCEVRDATNKRHVCARARVGERPVSSRGPTAAGRSESPISEWGLGGTAPGLSHTTAASRGRTARKYRSPILYSSTTSLHRTEAVAHHFVETPYEFARIEQAIIDRPCHSR